MQVRTLFIVLVDIFGTSPYSISLAEFVLSLCKDIISTPNAEGVQIIKYMVLLGGRVQSMSCSKDCKCSDKCSNKPFRKDKRLRVCKVSFTF